MISLVQWNLDRWHKLSWWLCVVTLPWIDMANNISLILLTLGWVASGEFRLKWQRLKSSRWTWPFLLYYMLLLVGLIYTPDVGNGLFTLDKKITFFILPIIAATGQPMEQKFISFLTRNFVYSCVAVFLLCLVMATYFYFSGGAVSNFDIRTNESFSDAHSDASPAWMHFSYIQLAYWAGFHPGYLSMYLVFCLVILFTENYKSRQERNIHLLLGCLLVCFLSLLATRIAIIAFIVTAAYLGMEEIKKRRAAYLPIAFATVILIGLVWLNPVARFRVIEEPLNTNYQANQSVTNWNSVSFRLLEWQGSWSVIRAHWLTGVGTGGGKKAMHNFYSHYNSSTVDLKHNAHNQYLQVWMESGLFGLAAFLLCLITGLFTLHKDAGYVSFVVIFSLMCLTESFGERQKGVVFFTLFQVLFLGSIKGKE